MTFSNTTNTYNKRARQYITMPLAMTVFTLSPLAMAIDEAKRPALEEVMVTAQKRSQNLQDVPISINALGTETLKRLNITDFDDFAKMLPSVSYTSISPGFAQVYMRGVASGGDGNHSGSQPSVGMYLDEQPITTIQGALDIHIYDVARVEALAGPQGTLYGASSQAGTIRIITNKPDVTEFSAGYAIEGNRVDNDDTGHVLEGFVNIPLSDKAAVRIVAWDKHDAGFIDNVRSTRVYPTSGIAIDNSSAIEDNYNTADTTGARLALKIDLNDNWTVTPAVMTQKQDTEGTFAYDDTIGVDKIAHSAKESTEDEWTQAALTVEGVIGNFDLVYAGSYLDREVDSELDYQDYAFWYDSLYGYGVYFYDNASDYIDPSQYIQGNDGYQKESHELRLSSPQGDKLSYVVGLFWQKQKHDITQRYIVDDLADINEVPGWEDTIWLTSQSRTDKDKAIFGEVSYAINDKLTATAGARFFESDNSLRGFFGYAENFSSRTGVAACFSDESIGGAPCLNLDKKTDESDNIKRFNLTYQIDDDKMIYGTFSEGYRPGGINRRGTLPPYVSDFLTNYEFGWKTTWMDSRLKFNGAIFKEEWDDFQFSFLGANGLTEIKNANQAEIIGLEMDAEFAATNNFTLTAGIAFYDAQLTDVYCGTTDAQGNPITNCAVPQAEDGDQLPITAEVKGNLTARYTFVAGGFDSHLQAAVVYEGERESDLLKVESEILGPMDSYTITDLSAGIKNENFAVELYIKNAFDERAELSKYSQCATTTCGAQALITTNQPRTIGIRFSQEF
ncbi:TonB-dependent receptor [Dasania marina]|uniref:TonB-dependent receptor n=1 Tax=Dasania marina TaxID=471499 RepID=UPI0030DC3C69